MFERYLEEKFKEEQQMRYDLKIKTYFNPPSTLLKDFFLIKENSIFSFGVFTFIKYMHTKKANYLLHKQIKKVHMT